MKKSLSIHQGLNVSIKLLPLDPFYPSEWHPHKKGDKKALSRKKGVFPVLRHHLQSKISWQEEEETSKKDIKDITE